MVTGTKSNHECNRGDTVHRCIDISRYFSRDTYRDIVFLLLQFFFFGTMIFISTEKIHNNRSTCDFCKVIPQIHNYFVKIFCENIL